MEIKKTSKIEEVFNKHPEVAEVMNKHGLHCIGCMMSRFETLEEGAKAHGANDEDIDCMIKEMNEVVGGKENEDNS